MSNHVLGVANPASACSLSLLSRKAFSSVADNGGVLLRQIPCQVDSLLGANGSSHGHERMTSIFARGFPPAPERFLRPAPVTEIAPEN